MSRALHASAGFAYKLTPTLTLESVGFYKRYYDLVSRSALPTPPVAQALTQDGIGRSYGGQVLLRQEHQEGLLRLDHLFADPQRAARSPGPGLPPVRLRSDARVRRAGELRPRPRLGGRQPLPLHERHAAHAGGRRVLRQQHRSLRADLRRAQLDPDPVLLPARRARRESGRDAAGEAEHLPRRAEPDQPQEPRGAHLQLRLQQAQHITGLPTLAVLGARMDF